MGRNGKNILGTVPKRGLRLVVICGSRGQLYNSLVGKDFNHIWPEWVSKTLGGISHHRREAVK